VTLPFNHNDRMPGRHDLVFVAPFAWRSMLRTRPELAGDPLVAGWVDQVWPLVARRFTPDETDGVALGLPLPPSAGKRRVAVLMQHGDIVSTTPPPCLSAAAGAAPETWKRTLEMVVSLAAQHRVEARVFGSLSWQLLTGLDYLTASSDLDLLLPLPRRGEVTRLTAALAAIERDAPIRLDGELVRADGAAVNWRELHTGARDVLVKTIHGVAVFRAADFLAGALLS
jgi:phosphoribosyl-dephospho-CoA transferase